jgi:hypothetical protein
MAGQGLSPDVWGLQHVTAFRRCGMLLPPKAQPQGLKPALIRLPLCRD